MGISIRSQSEGEKQFRAGIGATMKNKLRDWKRVYWNKELAEDFLCAIALFSAIAYVVIIGLGGK